MSIYFINNYIRAEEMERNSRNQVKDEQELAFQEAQLRDQQREVREKDSGKTVIIIIVILNKEKVDK